MIDSDLLQLKMRYEPDSLTPDEQLSAAKIGGEQAISDEHLKEQLNLLHLKEKYEPNLDITHELKQIYEPQVTIGETPIAGNKMAPAEAIVIPNAYLNDAQAAFKYALIPHLPPAERVRVAETKDWGEIMRISWGGDPKVGSTNLLAEWGRGILGDLLGSSTKPSTYLFAFGLQQALKMGTEALQESFPRFWAYINRPLRGGSKAAMEKVVADFKAGKMTPEVEELIARGRIAPEVEAFKNFMERKGHVFNVDLPAKQEGEGIVRPQAAETIRTVGPGMVKESSVIKNILETESTPEPIKVGAAESPYRYYKPVSVAGSIKKAQDILQKNYDKAVEIFKKGEGELSIAIGESLYAEQLARGNTEDALKTLDILTQRGQKFGRGINLYKVLYDTTPRGRIAIAKRMIDSFANQFYAKRVQAAQRLMKKTGEAYDVIAKRLGIPVMDDAFAKRLYAQFDLAEGMPEGPARDAIIKEGLQMVADKLPITTMEKLDAYAYTNMLFAPRPQIRNVFWNTETALVTRPTEIGGEVVVDALKAITTGGSRSRSFGEIPAYYRGMINARLDAYRNAAAVIRGDIPIENLDTGTKDIIQKLRQKNIPKVLSFTTRMMEAADIYAQDLISAGERERLAAIGKTGPEADREALTTAKRLLVRGESDPENITKQGKLNAIIDRVSSGIGQFRKHHPSFRLFVRFLHTPTEIIKTQTERTPIGAAINLAGQEDKTGAYTRLALSSLISGIGGILAWTGKTTWNPPRDTKLREQWFAAGNKPASVWITLPGGREVCVPQIIFGPYALSLAIPAAIKYYADDSKESLSATKFQKAIGLIEGLAHFYTNQTYFQGIAEFVQTVTGEANARFDKAFAKVATQFDPLSGLQRYITTYIDPVFRKKESPIDEFKSITPGLSTSLEAYREPDQRPAERNISSYIAPYDIGVLDKAMQEDFKKSLVIGQWASVAAKERRELDKDQNKRLLKMHDDLRDMPAEYIPTYFQVGLENKFFTEDDLKTFEKKYLRDIGLSVHERYLKGQTNEAKSKYIVEQVKKMDNPEDIANFLSPLIEKKIIDQHTINTMIRMGTR